MKAIAWYLLMLLILSPISAAPLSDQDFKIQYDKNRCAGYQEVVNEQSREYLAIPEKYDRKLSYRSMEESALAMYLIVSFQNRIDAECQQQE